MLSCQMEKQAPEEDSGLHSERDVFHKDESETYALFEAVPEDDIEIANIDISLLQHLLVEGINKVREEEGIQPLDLNDKLSAAAKNQNAYQIVRGELSHFQGGDQYRTVKDRVKEYGGDFNSIGENVQMRGFIIRTIGDRQDIVSTTYSKMANDLVQGWVDSPGHFTNLIDRNFSFVGTAIGYSDKSRAIYATQVYGGKQ